ncbi:LysR substrate-binding domain-containing protein [Leucobacter sp. GX24907]
MDLRQVECAVAVAEELHFGRAADRLRVPQPSLSRQVRDLERELGVRLFERTSRRVEITAAGEAFVDSAGRLLAMVDETRSAARAAAEGATGRVTLGFVSSAAIRALPAVIALQRERAPRVRVTLREMSSTGQVEALRARSIDVGIVRDLADPEGLRTTPLFREPLYAAVPLGHPLLGSGSNGDGGSDADRDSASGVECRRLVEFDLVTLPTAAAPRIRGLLESAAHVSGTALRCAQEASQYATLLALVAAAVGVAVIPDSVRGLRQHDVRYLPLRDAGAWSELRAIIRDDESAPAARGLHATAVNALRGADQGAGSATGPGGITPV